MRIVLPLAFLLLASSPVLQTVAQGGDAVALAAQQDAEERYKRLAADVQSLQEAQEVLQKHLDDVRQRLSRMDEELRSVREEVNRSSANYVTRDDLRKYLEKFSKEVDERREADKKLILQTIKELGNAPAPTQSEPAKIPAPRRAAETSEESNYVYTIKKNDRLLDIIAAYNDHYQKEGLPKITKEDVLRANPNMKPDLLRTGQKIKIPIPSKDRESK
jgi:hypothetical protein